MTEFALGRQTSRFEKLLALEISTTPEMFVAVVALYFTVFCNSRFWLAILGDRPLQSTGSVKIAVSTLLLLSAGHALLLALFSFRSILKPFVLLLLPVNGFTIYFIDRLGAYVDPSMIRNVFQTDVAETAELLTWRMLPYVAFYALLPAFFVLRTRFPQTTFATAAKRRGIFVICTLLALGAAGLVSLKEYSSFFRNNKEARYLVTPGNYMISISKVALSSGSDLRRERIPVGTDASLGPNWIRSDRPVLFVFVVGETARAANFSLNGYARATNPELARIPGLVNFSSVASCGTSTADSLPCMFSHFGKSDPDVKKARQYESLLDVVRHSGLDVEWIDNNSGCKGVCAGVETESLEHASSATLCPSGECFDEILLTALESRLAGPARSRVLVMHQKGSHGPAYHRRYPPAFNTFTPSCASDDFEDCTQDEIRNAYDNSILYTDFVLGQIIERLDAASTDYDTALLYVSDHGESLGEKGFYLHGLPYAIAPDTQTHVPMVFWTSPQFAERFSMNRDQLARDAATGKYSHDNLFHSVLGLLDIESTTYDSRLDLFGGSRVTKDAHAALRGADQTAH